MTRNGALLTMQTCSSMRVSSWTAQWVLPSQHRCSGMPCQHHDGVGMMHHHQHCHTGSSSLMHHQSAQYGCCVIVALLPLASKQHMPTQPRQHQGDGMGHSNFPEPSSLVYTTCAKMPTHLQKTQTRWACTMLCNTRVRYLVPWCTLTLLRPEGAKLPLAQALCKCSWTKANTALLS